MATKSIHRIAVPATDYLGLIKEYKMYEIAFFFLLLFGWAAYSFVNRDKANVVVTDVVDEVVIPEPEPAALVVEEPEVITPEPEPVVSEDAKVFVQFELRDADLLQAIFDDGKLEIYHGNTIYLHVNDEGKVEIPGNVPVLKVNKNIRCGLRQVFIK